MLTYQECLDMCDLTPDEIAAIAEHEHLDSMIAVALGQYLITHNGESKIKRIILDDIDKALREGQRAHARLLKQVLEHFVASHPEHNAIASAA